MGVSIKERKKNGKVVSSGGFEVTGRRSPRSWQRSKTGEHPWVGRLLPLAKVCAEARVDKVNGCDSESVGLHVC